MADRRAKMSIKIAIFEEAVMNKQYSIAEARDHLPSIVHGVERGTPIELTRRGKPVAVLMSVEDYHRLSPVEPSFQEAYGRLRDRPEFRDVDVEPESFEGVRDPSPGRTVDL
jgi:antitoxin Phd